MNSGWHGGRDIGVLLVLMGVMLSGCGAHAEVARSDTRAEPAAKQEQIIVPDALRGVWYADGTEGRTACRAYLSIDAATVERTGMDPLVGAVVVSRRMVHRYSEYGEGNFFRVDRARKDSAGAWALSGQMFFDSVPSDGEPGVTHSERLELTGNGQSFSSSEAKGVSYFKCGEVRSDLYRAQ